MKERLLSASIALPIVVGFIFLGGIWFSLLITFGASVSGYEVSKMLRLRGINLSPIATSISAGVVVPLAFMLFKIENAAYLFSLCVIIGGVASIIWISSIRVRNSSNIVAITGILAVTFYVGGFLGHAPLIRESEHGLEWILLLLFVTTLTDTGAYAIGKAFGKTPFFPKISPSKTLEGAIGGLLFGTIGAIISAVVLANLEIGFIAVTAIGIILSLGAQAGDLFESSIKRLSGVKDSGSLMPGHGGALDRLDSIVFNLALLYHFVQWMSV